MFLVCARIVTSFAFGAYGSERTPLMVVCVLILTVLCCLFMSILQTLYPSAKGSGIPLAEGFARGMLRVKWFRSAAALIAGSLLSFLSGMPLGSEGPSIGVGGLIGDGIGRAAKKPTQFRRFLITGGSSAGLAVAFNAPLTGVTFALEETHRRFSSGILLAAFSAVIPAVLVSQLMYLGFGQIAFLRSLDIHAGAAVLPFLTQAVYKTPSAMFKVCGIAALCGIACAVLAALFNLSIFSLGKLFGKIQKPFLRLLPAFLLTAVCGLFFARSVGSGEATFAGVSVTTAAWLLLLLLAVRFVITVVASGSGATGGLFLPMIAIGGLLGTLAAKIAISCGLDGRYAPNIIILCISAFFAASARAPISAIAMSVELTVSFTNLLPCVIAVATALAVVGILRTSPLYERMMEDLYKSTKQPMTDITVTGVIHADSAVCGMRIREVLWPYNSLVTKLVRSGNDIVPDGETVLCAGDVITIRAEKTTRDIFAEQIKDYLTYDEPNR